MFSYKTAVMAPRIWRLIVERLEEQSTRSSIPKQKRINPGELSILYLRAKLGDEKCPPSKRRERLIVYELAWNPNRRSGPFRSHFSDPLVHIDILHIY